VIVVIAASFVVAAISHVDVDVDIGDDAGVDVAVAQMIYSKTKALAQMTVCSIES